MCVAEWKEWRAYDGNGCLDLQRMAKYLKATKRILLTTIRSSKA